MLRGVPFFGELNKEIYSNIFSSKSEKEIDISLYDLAQLVLESNKNYVVVVGRFVTWLDDISFNYKSKQCYISYYIFEERHTTIDVDTSRLATRTKYHLKTDENGYLILPYNYSERQIDISIGSKLLIYSIRDKSLVTYHVTSYCDVEFSLSRLYDLYINSCYRDLDGAFTDNDSGYTYITKVVKGFSNYAKRVREELDLPHFACEQRRLDDYIDVRIYDYWDYLNRYKNSNVSNELFRYRRLRFESYLYCCLRQHLVPVDEPDWGKLGKSMSYIKIKSKRVPFFIKSDWLDGVKTINKTWRKI